MHALIGVFHKNMYGKCLSIVHKAWSSYLKLKCLSPSPGF